MRQMTVIFTICLLVLFALEASAQPMPGSELTQAGERLTIPVKWGPVGKWGGDLGTSSGGRLYVDEKTVYILGLWRILKGKNFINKDGFLRDDLSRRASQVRFVSGVHALTKESGALRWKFEAEEGVFDGFDLGDPWMGVAYDGIQAFECFDLCRLPGETQPRPMVNAMSAGHSLYFQVGDALHALDRDTGAEKWKSEASQRRFLWLSRFLVICVVVMVVVVLGRLFRLSRRAEVIVLAVAILFTTIIEVPRRLATPPLRPAAFQVADGSVYFRSSSGVLYALAADTGELRWQRDLIPSWKGLFHSFLRSFGIKAKMPNLPAPVISDSVIITQYDIRGETSRLAALDAKTGDIFWASKERVVAGEPLIAASETVYAPASDRVVALAAETGMLKWQSDKIETSDYAPEDVARLSGFVNDVEQLEQVSFEVRAFGPPHLLALEGDFLYVLMSVSGSLAGTDERDAWARSVRNYGLLALSAATGEVRWEKYSRDEPKTVVAANDVLIYQMAGKLHALSAETGETQWQLEEGNIPYGCRPMVQGSTVYVPCAKTRLLDTGSHISEDRLYALDLNTGRIKWQSPKEVREVRGSVTHITPIEIRDYAIALDGTAYISTDGFVFALAPR